MSEEDFNNQDDNNQDDEGGQPPMSESEKQLQELKSIIEKQNAQIEASQKWASQLQSEKDRLLNTRMEELEELARKQKAANVQQNNQNASIDTITDQNELTRLIKAQASEIQKAYLSGDITESQKDDALLNVNLAYSDRKAQLAAEKAMEQARQEYTQTSSKTTAAAKWNQLFVDSGIHIEGSEARNQFMQCATDGLFDYGKVVAGDPEALQVALNVVNRVYGKKTIANNQIQPTGFNPPSGASGGDPVINSTKPNGVLNDLYQNPADASDIIAYAKQKYGNKLVDQMIKRSNSKNK